MNKSKKKERKRIIRIIGIIILLSVIGHWVYTYISNYYSEERRIINYALGGSEKNFKLHRIEWDPVRKSIVYQIIDKNHKNRYKIGPVRQRMIEYLKNNPSYFLNEDYSIVLSWRSIISGHPTVLSFSNMDYINDSSGEPIIVIDRKALDCLVITNAATQFTLSDIPDFSLYDDIKGIKIDSFYDIKDYELLQNFKSLKYLDLSGKVKEEYVEQIVQLLPDCEIYGKEYRE